MASQPRGVAPQVDRAARMISEHKNCSPRNAYSVPMPRIAKAHIVPDYRPLVKDVIKLLRSHGAVPMPADVQRRLKKASMHGMPAE